jgi:hypothetical protein
MLLRDVNSLLVFEIQMLRRIFGADKTKEKWRIGNNDKFEK